MRKAFSLLLMLCVAITAAGQAQTKQTKRKSQMRDSVQLDNVTVVGKSKTQRLREGALAVNAIDVRSMVNTLTYSRNDNLTEINSKGNHIDSYSHYYSIVDLRANTRTRMAYNGTENDYSSGRFSQRSAVDRAEGKAYFGVNTSSAQPSIYVYDIKSDNVTKGIDVVEGYYFEQIRLVED